MAGDGMGFLFVAGRAVRSTPFSCEQAAGKLLGNSYDRDGHRSADLSLGLARNSGNGERKRRARAVEMPALCLCSTGHPKYNYTAFGNGLGVRQVQKLVRETNHSARLIT